MSDEYISEDGLNWALTHIREFGDTDLFPPLFEFDLIHQRWSQFLPLLTRIDLTAHQWQAPRRWLIPKDQVSFRTATQLDPLDALIFAALVHDCGPAVERLRIPFAKNTTYSYRVDIQDDGTLYRAHTREAFWAETRRLSSEHAQVAVIDITDFYNQIEHSAVLSQLEAASISKVRRTILGTLLKHAALTADRGIPVGPPSSHILAEAALIPLDNFLDAQYQFTRYADDVHVFCDTYEEAQAAIFGVADFLYKHQRLTLNRQKTDVKPGSEISSTASRMMIDDPINKAEKRILYVLRTNLEERGEVEGDDYSTIQLSDLDKADAAAFSPRLIESVFEPYLAGQGSYLRLRWFLRRLGQIGAPGGLEYVAANIDRFAPAIVDAVRYLGSAAVTYEGSWPSLGALLIKALDNPLVRANEYLQVSIIGLFWRVTDLNHIRALLGQYQHSGPSVRREIALAASAQIGSDWIRQHLNSLTEMDVWLRRAVLHAMRGLPEPDRRRYGRQTIMTAEDLMTNSLLQISDETPHSTRTESTNGLRPTVGIITALPKELAAMRVLLSNPRRATIDRAGGMKECYLGTVPARDGKSHCVALALSGMGNNQAAARATNLLRDFPTIVHIIMVGIAGGVPDVGHPENHVRLGDIVVSGERGVEQYDLIKQTADSVVHRSPPRPPSASVLEAVRFLEAESITGPLPCLPHINAGLKGLRIRRPAAKFDVLTASDNPAVLLRHPRDNSRKARCPRVFVGPIAAANVLLKDPVRRDQLRDTFGARAVEMEGSGIADATWDHEVGYLVVRGICDYCDMNKNDRWQAYAAVAAAGYVRSLLESMASRAT